MLGGNGRTRAGNQQRPIGWHLRAHHPDHLRGQAAAVVERHETARAEQPLEPAIAREKRALVILDDHLELEQHDTLPSQFPLPLVGWG